MASPAPNQDGGDDSLVSPIAPGLRLLFSGSSAMPNDLKWAIDVDEARAREREEEGDYEEQRERDFRAWLNNDAESRRS